MMARCLLLLMACVICARAQISEQTQIAVEALLRLEGAKLEQNPKLQAVVDKLLVRTKGTPEFIKLVEHFNIRGQEEGLFEAALQHPQTDAAADAMKMLVEAGATNMVLTALNS